MYKNTFKIFSILTFTLFVFAGTTWAREEGRDRHRGGELTRHERQTLKQERNQVRQFEKFAAADGRVSRQERRLLDNMHDRMDRNHHHFRHKDVRPYDCQRGCRHGHEHRWREYRHHYPYRPYGYYYPSHDHYRFSGAWFQPGGFFSISVGGN